jgi:hypothetical protein
VTFSDIQAVFLEKDRNGIRRGIFGKNQPPFAMCARVAVSEKKSWI